MEEGVKASFEPTLHCSQLFATTFDGYFARIRRDLQAVCEVFLSCLNSKSSLVKLVARYGVDVARYNSCVGRNVLFSCKYFNWSLSDFLGGNVSLNFTCFRKLCISKFSNSELNIANSLYEALLVNNGDLFIDNFNRDEVDSIIVAMSTS